MRTGILTLPSGVLPQQRQPLAAPGAMQWLDAWRVFFGRLFWIKRATALGAAGIFEHAHSGAEGGTGIDSGHGAEGGAGQSHGMNCGPKPKVRTEIE